MIECGIMNFRFIRNVGLAGLALGMGIAGAGIATGILPLIIGGAVVLMVTFVVMQAGWFLKRAQ